MSIYILSEEALQDIAEITSYLERNSPQAAVRLIDKIMERCQRLADFPNMGRRWEQINPPLRSFPVEEYLIFYRGIPDGIEVVRVVSGYRDLRAVFEIDDEE